jgi:endonuclease/exonuclease/phosphatase family metal-dependent hydrolase
VSGIFNQCDTLHVFVNHWPSRYGGIMETEKLRRLAAETLRKSVVELQMKFPKAKIICMGDFNDSPADESIVRFLNAKKVDQPSIEDELVNLSAEWVNDPVQTIKGQYTWEVFDQFIVSDYFLEKNDCYESPKAEILKAEFLLEPDVKYGGVKPRRTYVGFKYQEGFSDHLPVVLRVRSLIH